MRMENLLVPQNYILDLRLIKLFGDHFQKNNSNTSILPHHTQNSLLLELALDYSP